MLDARNGELNKTCLLLTESCSLMEKVDKKIDTVVSKRYSNRKVQKNIRVFNSTWKEQRRLHI